MIIIVVICLRNYFFIYRASIPGDTLYSRDTGSALSLGSVGTRRTVYLAEEDAPAPVSANAPVPPLLVYNRISTVIGDPQQHNLSAQRSQSREDNSQQLDITNHDRKSRDQKKENEIWYEYGCV